MSKNKAHFSLQNGLIGEANSQRNQKKNIKQSKAKKQTNLIPKGLKLYTHLRNEYQTQMTFPLAHHRRFEARRPVKESPLKINKINNQQRILLVNQVRPIHKTMFTVVNINFIYMPSSEILPESHPYIAMRKQADVPW